MARKFSKHATGIPDISKLERLDRLRQGRSGAPNPTRVERGVVVQFRDNRGKLMKSRGIVMGNAPPTNYSRAYGREVYVCEVDRPRVDRAGWNMIVKDAIESRNKVDIERVVTATTFIHEKNAGMLKPVGRVKKIPKICALAMKIEKGKL